MVIMIKAIEKYYTVQQLACLLEFDASTIRAKAAQGQFGPGVLNVGGKDIRIPASGVNAWIENNRLVAMDLEPIAARTVGELGRKIAERQE